MDWAKSTQVLIKFIVYLRWSQISVYTNIKIFLSFEKGQWRRFWTAWKGSNGQPREGSILYQQWQEPNMKPSIIWNILHMVCNTNSKMQWLKLNWRIDSNYTSIKLDHHTTYLLSLESFSQSSEALESFFAWEGFFVFNSASYSLSSFSCTASVTW